MLVSLFYVAITLIEFAFVLLIKRNIGKSIAKRNPSYKRPVVVAPINDAATNNICKARGAGQQSSGDSLAVDLTTTIDKTTCILFLFSYFLFNLVYVFMYIDRK